jgi:hypothetical protein
VDPFGYRGIYGPFAASLLSVLMDPFLGASFSVLFFFWRGLASKNLEKPCVLRHVNLVVSVSCPLLLVLVVASAWTDTFLPYVIFWLAYLTPFSVAFAYYGHKFVSQSLDGQGSPAGTRNASPRDISMQRRVADAKSANQLEARCASHGGVIRSPENSTRSPRIPARPSTPRYPRAAEHRRQPSIRANMERSTAKMRIARLSVGTTLCCLLIDALLLYGIFRQSVMTAQKQILTTFAIRLTGTVWAALIVLTFWDPTSKRVVQHVAYPAVETPRLQRPSAAFSRDVPSRPPSAQVSKAAFASELKSAADHIVTIVSPAHPI